MPEIELKLDLTPEAAEALAGSDLLAGKAAVARQRTTYFDTPAHDLRAAGFSVRIREAGGRRIQTVKAAGTEAAGLFVRPEWERAVDGDRPVLDGTTPVAALLGKRARDIAPVFAVDVERRSWNLPWEEALVELVLDRGEVVAGGRREAICEIELELKRGEPRALFALARRIDAIAPLRLGVLNKAERGYRLLGPPAGALKAAPVALAGDVTAAAAFRQIAGACLRHFRLNEPLIDRAEPEAVHQTRVALRRLRSAFSIFRPILEDGAFQRLREETRWLAGTLGEARDLDVLIAAGGDAGAEAPARLEQARDDAYGRAEAALASWRARALMLDLSEWLLLGDWLTQPAGHELREQPARDFAAAALDRLRRKVRKGGRDLAEMDDATRHELRKDAKKLRYAAEFFGALFDGKRRRRRQERFVAALAALQDRLGALNDLTVAADTMFGLGLQGKAGRKPDPDKAELIEAAAEAHDAFADTKRFWR